MPDPVPLRATEESALRSAFHSAPSRLILLDYDGTLKSFVDRPEDAFPDSELLELLHALAALPATELVIVTGRGRDNMQSWLGELPLGLSTEHGLWIRLHGDEQWSHMLPPGTEPRVLDPVRAYMEDVQSKTPGSRVEVKDASLAFHYRRVDPERAPALAREMLAELERLRIHHDAPLDVLDGKMVIEVRIHGVHKGNIAPFLDARGKSYAFRMALGDDATDENMFTALGPEDWTVKVGPGPSAARLRVADVPAVRSLLAGLTAGDTGG